MFAATAAPMPSRESNFRDVTVKVHIRRPEKDSWMYLGRGIASHEMTGHSSRVGELKLEMSPHSDHPLTQRLAPSASGPRAVIW